MQREQEGLSSGGKSENYQKLAEPEEECIHGQLTPKKESMKDNRLRALSKSVGKNLLCWFSSVATCVC